MLALSAEVARAQLAPVGVGARVRLEAPAVGVQRLDATVVGVDGDSLEIERHGARRWLAVHDIRRLELYRGRDRASAARRGALWGAGIGTFLGLTIAGMTSAHTRECALPNSQQCELAPWPVRKVVGWTALTAVGTGAYGAGVGALLGRERWERVLPARAAIAPAPGGVGVRVAFGGR
jgi:hypothetical protein